MHVLHSLGQRPWVGYRPHNFSNGCQTIQFIQPTAPPATHRTLLVVSAGEQKESNINSFWGLVQIPGWVGGSAQYLNAEAGTSPLESSQRPLQSGLPGCSRANHLKSRAVDYGHRHWKI